jgi:hypothetical protein
VHAIAQLTAHVRARGLPALNVSAAEFASFQLNGSGSDGVVSFSFSSGQH